jgi:hypothetical protein
MGLAPLWKASDKKRNTTKIPNLRNRAGHAGRVETPSLAEPKLPRDSCRNPAWAFWPDLARNLINGRRHFFFSCTTLNYPLPSRCPLLPFAVGVGYFVKIGNLMFLYYNEIQIEWGINNDFKFPRGN